MYIKSMPKQSGKTTTLIELSESMNIPIYCKNMQEARLIKSMAKNLTHNIPEPIVYSPNNKGNEVKGLKHILIDNLDMFYEIPNEILSIAYAATITSNEPYTNPVLPYIR